MNTSAGGLSDMSAVVAGHSPSDARGGLWLWLPHLAVALILLAVYGVSFNRFHRRRERGRHRNLERISFLLQDYRNHLISSEMLQNSLAMLSRSLQHHSAPQVRMIMNYSHVDVRPIMHKALEELIPRVLVINENGYDTVGNRLDVALPAKATLPEPPAQSQSSVTRLTRPPEDSVTSLSELAQSAAAAVTITTADSPTRHQGGALPGQTLDIP